MKCPLTSKCYESLSKQLTKARLELAETKADAIQEITRLNAKISLLEWRISTYSVAIEDLNCRARKKRAGYSASKNRPSKPTLFCCKMCNSVEAYINFDDNVRYRCQEFIIQVDCLGGTCPHHSSKLEINKKR